MHQRGFTLVEVLVVAAVAVLAAAMLAISVGAQPFAMRSGIEQFDAAVAYARSIAATSGNGATIVFTPRALAGGAPQPGFIATIYAGRPNAPDAMQRASVAPLAATGQIAETTLGSPPFTVFFDSAGHATAMTGAVSVATQLSSQPACPGAGGLTFTVSDPRARQSRSLPCASPVSGAPAPPSPAAP